MQVIEKRGKIGLKKNKLAQVEEKRNESKAELIINGKKRLSVDEIFDYRLFYNGEKMAVTYQYNGNVDFAIIEITRPISSHLALNPPPDPGFRIVIETAPESKKATAHFRSGGEFYIARDNMMIAGPFEKETVK